MPVTPHPQNPNFPASYDNPKSVCECGHTGDGKNSRHAATEFGTPGHGACQAPGCGCEKFRWSDWTKVYKKVLAELRSKK